MVVPWRSTLKASQKFQNRVALESPLRLAGLESAALRFVTLPGGTRGRRTRIASFVSLPEIARVIPRLLAVVSVASLAWLFGGCSRQPQAGAAVSTNALPTVRSSLAAGASPAVPEAHLSLHVGGVPGYAGSGACKECHEDQYASWHRTYHRTMTQLPTPEAVQADFNHVVLTNDGVRFTLSRRSNEFWVRMESALPAGPAEPVPQPVEVPLGLVTGSHHMQVFWVGNGMGNCQVGFPFTWLIPERRWVPRNSTFIRPPTVEHRSETWNFVCARCHATAPQPNLDRSALQWHTRVAELGISCEACHGPGERHAAQQREWRRQQSHPPAAATNLFIVQPRALSAERASQICGFCHSMKWWDGKEGWPHRPFAYLPGEDLEATTPVMRPKQIERQPWLHGVLERNPEIFRDFFWSDGMIRVSGREYNGLIESPCFRGGQFSCLSCHSMHASDPDDMLARHRADHRACTQCHDRFRDEAALTAHTRHRPGSSGSECYNCHMPHTTYGVLKAIRSHQVSTPRVADQQITGRPNACNLCHLDKPLAWTVHHLTQWYGQPAPELSPDETNVADAVRLALAGDAGQRALVAWHLGWEPAVRVSGQAWIPAILGHLLDDPYAAVRAVAERSLRGVSNLVPADYDFTVSPGSRPPVWDAILESWSKQAPPKPPVAWHAATLVDLDNRDTTREALRRLARQRNDTPLRLRE